MQSFNRWKDEIMLTLQLIFSPQFTSDLKKKLACSILIREEKEENSAWERHKTNQYLVGYRTNKYKRVWSSFFFFIFAIFFFFIQMANHTQQLWTNQTELTSCYFFYIHSLTWLRDWFVYMSVYFRFRVYNSLLMRRKKVYFTLLENNLKRKHP